MAILRANNNTLSSVTALPFATGGLVLLNHTSVSSSTASIVYDNSLITSTYNNYKILWSNFVPVSANITLRVKVSTDNGSNFLTFLNGRRYNGISLTAGANQDQQSSSDGLMLGMNLNSTASKGVISGEITISGVNNTVGYKYAWGKAVFNADGGDDRYWQDMAGVMSSASDIDYMRIECSSGNIASGEFSLYGYLKS